MGTEKRFLRGYPCAPRRWLLFLFFYGSERGGLGGCTHTFRLGIDDTARFLCFPFTLVQSGDVLRVTNGFISDWMPSGYRDVKLNAVVDGHLCEIQLHLREFHDLKRHQHVVYEWARDLNVTKAMVADQLFENLSCEVMDEMIRLAEEGNWHETGFLLPRLQLSAGRYAQAEEGHRKVLGTRD